MSKQGLGAVLGVAVAGWDVWAGCGGSACVHGQATWAGGRAPLQPPESRDGSTPVQARLHANLSFRKAPTRLPQEATTPHPFCLSLSHDQRFSKENFRCCHGVHPTRSPTGHPKPPGATRGGKAPTSARRKHRGG